jgi:Cu/Ag efflux pump CusA
MAPALSGRARALEDDMSRALSVIPGVSFGFSQPISDNVEEALTGVKGQLAIKVVGDNLDALDDLGSRIAQELAGVAGVRDLGIFREIGQSNLHVEIDRRRAERLGLKVEDVEAMIEAGVGGRAVTQIVEGERTHELVVRFREQARDRADAIARLPVPTNQGHTVPLREVASLRIQGGASRVYREDGRRYLAIKFSVRGRDLGSTVHEAQRKVARAVRVPPGYELSWGGEFESAQRAGKRLSLVIPLTIGLIFVLLFAMFRRTHEALLILGNVLVTSPFGGLLALLVTGINFSGLGGRRVSGAVRRVGADRRDPGVLHQRAARGGQAPGRCHRARARHAPQADDDDRAGSHVGPVAGGAQPRHRLRLAEADRRGGGRRLDLVAVALALHTATLVQGVRARNAGARAAAARRGARSRGRT